MWDLIGLIIIFPLIGLAVNLIIGDKVGRKWIGMIACGSVCLSFLTALIYAILFYIKYPVEGFAEVKWYQWIVSGVFNIDFGFRIDWLSLIMVLTVSLVG